jgi:hypothetical protein
MSFRGKSNPNGENSKLMATKVGVCLLYGKSSRQAGVTGGK